MDKMNISQLLARDCVIMKNEMTTEEPGTATTHPIETDLPDLIIMPRIANIDLQREALSINKRAAKTKYGIFDVKD